VQFNDKFNLKLLQPTKTGEKSPNVVAPNYLIGGGESAEGK
jgi:hypothetical protein